MILAAIAVASTTPSFDCARASTAVEKMICGDEQLAHLDAAMAAAYANLPGKQREQQKGWLKERDACGTHACLLEQYEGRVADAIMNDAAGVRHYHSRPNQGELDILSLGDGWYAFSAVGLWPTPGGSVNIAEATGSFLLNSKGAAFRPPTSGGDCGWKVQRLPGDRWELSTLPPQGTAAPECYGVNATIDGTYSSSQRKPK